MHKALKLKGWQGVARSNAPDIPIKFYDRVILTEDFALYITTTDGDETIYHCDPGGKSTRLHK